MKPEAQAEPAEQPAEQSDEQDAEALQKQRDEEYRREVTAAAKNASGGTAGDELLIGSDAREAKLKAAEQGAKEREEAGKS